MDAGYGGYSPPCSFQGERSPGAALPSKVPKQPGSLAGNAKIANGSCMQPPRLSLVVVFIACLLPPAACGGPVDHAKYEACYAHMNPDLDACSRTYEACKGTNGTRTYVQLAACESSNGTCYSMLYSGLSTCLVEAGSRARSRYHACESRCSTESGQCYSQAYTFAASCRGSEVDCRATLESDYGRCTDNMGACHRECGEYPCETCQ